MGIETDGRGLSSRQVEALTAGLTAMERPDAQVVLTDDFECAVRRLIDSDTYTADRGDGVVAGKTIATTDGPIIVFNATELRERGDALIERTAAHEAGHVHLLDRGENVLPEKERLVDREWRWRLLQVGGYAAEEYRIERAVIDLGYPTAESGTVESAAEALSTLNIEIVHALIDDASDDPRAFAAAVLGVHSWVTVMLAYAAAGGPDDFDDAVRACSERAADHWDEYIGDTWNGRAAFYRSLPSARQPMTEGAVDAMLLATVEHERALLAQFGFTFSGKGVNEQFRRIASNTTCTRRLNRARDELAEASGQDDN